MKVKLSNNEKVSWGTRKDPPTEIRLFSFGLNKTSKGDIWLAKKDAQNILARVANRGNILLADFEHSMAQPAPEGAPASAQFSLKLKDDGMYATNIRWSDRALEYFKAREYFYYSPFCELEQRNDGKNWVVNLINFALTNTPATDNMIPLILSQLQLDTKNKTTILSHRKLSMNLEELKASLNKLLSENGLSPELAASLSESILGLLPEGEPDSEEAPADEPKPEDEELKNTLTTLSARIEALEKTNAEQKQTLARFTSVKAPTVSAEKLSKVVLTRSEEMRLKATKLSQEKEIPLVNAYLKVLRETK